MGGKVNLSRTLIKQELCPAESGPQRAWTLIVLKLGRWSTSHGIDKCVIPWIQ